MTINFYHGLTQILQLKSITGKNASNTGICLIF